MINFFQTVSSEINLEGKPDDEKLSCQQTDIFKQEIEMEDSIAFIEYVEESSQDSKEWNPEIENEFYEEIIVPDTGGVTEDCDYELKVELYIIDLIMIQKS